MNLLCVFLLLFAIRLASVFVVQTYFVPDEYWQSLEVAHKLTFGYGYLTWEWVHGLRSYLYPLVIAGIYKILAFLSLDEVQWLVLMPRILQATMSAYSDYRFYIWTGKKKWSVFLIAVPWFWFYMGSRTLSNTLETSMTTIALSLYPWYGEGTSYLWLAMLCCYLRPTAAIIWLPLFVYHLKKSRQSWTDLLFKRFFVIGLAIATFCVGIDSWMHGGLVITPIAFLKYNVYHNIGSFYGSHPWHWYFTVGLPTVLGINFLPFLFGLVDTIRQRGAYSIRKHLLGTILLCLVTLSLVDHKEFRFLSVLLPFCLYIAADTLTKWSYKASRLSLWLVASLLFVGNAVPAWYLSTIHQKEPIELMSKLGSLASSYRDQNNHPASILFLMPCHSTPFYSHLHQNVTMRFLTCEPNLKHLQNYKDEADQFFDSPAHWLRSHVPSYPRTAKPSHVVLFEPLNERIDEFLLDYKQVLRISNTEVHNKLETNLTPNDFFSLVSIKHLNINSVLQYMTVKTDRRIVVYERLRDGEDNLFNREYEEPHNNLNTMSEEFIDTVQAEKMSV